MNRSVGLSTGAALMLGAVLQANTGGAPAPTAGRASATPPATLSASAAEAIGSTAKDLSGEGPWLASCRYWETSTGLPYPKSDSKKGKGTAKGRIVKADGAKGKGAKGISGPKAGPSAGESKSECERNGDSWGLPAKASQARVTPNITAIIAAVPDPLHTHLALEFDRDIDAILHAAAENGFLVSHYWLPWKGPGQSAEGTPPSAAATPAAASEQAEQRKRELQPGLIVLKFAPQDDDPEHPPTTYDRGAYDRVIYLFLVGESPASGMNGAQLRNALRYEAMLQRKRPAIAVQLSMRGPKDLAVIGSPNSGSAVSLREAIEAANDFLHVDTVHVAGSTETAQANQALNLAFSGSSLSVQYLSFGEDFDYEEEETLKLLKHSGYATDRVAFLVEDGTVFGDSGKAGPAKSKVEAKTDAPRPLIVRFPREISLLRNAQASDKASSAPTPYLHLTLKDPAANDTVPHFSSEQTPLSQEAALMSIQRELVAYHAQFLAIQATNMLDEIYLFNYFHRACPNIRLVFLGGGDLLVEREVDNVPYIGSVSLTPYNLVGLARVLPNGLTSRAFTDSVSEAMFNAASYTFQDPSVDANRNPKLAGYVASPAPDAAGPSVHASLWATIIGSDGYYPLGVAASCASASPQSLPDFVAGMPRPCVPRERYPDASGTSPPGGTARNGTAPNGTAAEATAQSDEMQQFSRTAHLFPSLLWTVLSIVLGLYCLGHGAVVLAAGFWSPFTRDVAIRCNDQPTRRSVYMNIGTVMLFCMAFVLEWPAFSVGPYLTLNRASTWLAIGGLAAAAFALAATFFKTMPYAFRAPEWKGWQTFNSYQAACTFFNLAALATLAAVPAIWAHLCSLDAFGRLRTGYGVFFSYRCLHPDSQVSPVVPVLLVLLAWYLWAYCQTFRLRFSTAARPRLPGASKYGPSLAFTVTDAQLAACSTPSDSSLYENITCLLITRELVARFVPKIKTEVSIALAAVYVAVFVLFLHFRPIESVDRLVLDTMDRPTCYEALLVALTGPLLVIGLSGWLRMVLVWGSLRRGLLERLEMYPLRGAFTRLKGVGWMTMMRDTGLHTRWKDMARSLESVRQLLRQSALREAIETHNPVCGRKLDEIHAHLDALVVDATADSRGDVIMNPARRPPLQNPNSTGPRDLPDEDDILGLELIAAIESDYAAVCEIVLRAVLVPYWTNERTGFVEGGTVEPPSGNTNGAASSEADHIRLAEELLALRYLSLIRAVLGNIRYLMTFVSAAFVLSLVAWNSYPFQPRELVDWAFSLAFLVLGGGIVWVFAQMHRNAILSRITDTTPNELGFDFYWRIVTFGAIPLLTWLSYQFPQAWAGVFRLVQPGLSAVK